MRTMHRLKANFGMVPADEMDDYLDYDEESDEPADEVDYTRRGGQSERQRFSDPRADRGRLRDRDAVPARSGSTGVVHGALAMDDDEDELRLSDPATVQRDTARTTTSLRSPAAVRSGPCRITTLQPRSYNEARTVGERYRDGSPVIMNLTELDDAAAKRLVDFAAGLAFALRGSIDKVTNRVFLLSPPGVEVAPSDARRLAEHGLFGQD